MDCSSTFLTLSLFLLFALHGNIEAKIVIPEDGYTVTTVLDGHKQHVNPYSILQRPGSSDLIVLDSVNSGFYSVQIPISQESVFTRISGNGSPGYADGDVGSAQFDKPRSFAFDLRGNVYVADRSNHAIRKISANGVTTIAGGFSEKSSRQDGPANNISLSNDFELSFIPGLCALLVSDHMHQLVYQVNLNEEDCTLGSKSGLGAVMTWTLGLGLSCLLGIVFGIAIRPYIIPHEISSPYHFTATWKHYRIRLGKLVPILYSGIKNAAASCDFSSVYTILIRLWRLCTSQLLLMFRINVVSPTSRPHFESVSLLDLDACNSGEIGKSSKYHDQLKDLMSFDEGLLNSTFSNQGSRADFTGFAEEPKSKILQQQPSVCNLGIVKRRR